MAYQNLRCLRRAGVAASLLFFGSCLPAAGASASRYSALLNGLNPAFQDDGESGFVWRHRGVVASFRPTARVVFKTSAGRKAEFSFDGAAANVAPQGELPTLPLIHYYLGHPSRWHAAREFDRIRYLDIYPGVDLVFVLTTEGLEYNLELRPFANLSKIRIRYTGGTSTVNPKGDLEMQAGSAVILQLRPRVFQGKGSRELACSYHREPSGIITLNIPARDPREALLIDPVLNFSSYLGGPAFDAANAAATDSAGNVYLTGETSSGTMRGSALPNRSTRDVWIAKLNNTGTQVLYLAYAGGSGNDSSRGIAVDSSGNAYVTGYTASTDFPTTRGAFETHNAGAEDAFVLKLDPNGNIVYSTYLGGAGTDHGLAIAVDSTGSAYVAGQTGSVAFPTSTGALQTSNHGGLSDCFVAKLNPAASALTYSTYLGGLGLDLCTGIAVDTSGDAYVTGTTYSSDFPTQNPFQSSLLGTANAFVAEVNPYGSALMYSTFLGGSVVDNGNAIAVDSSGSAYVAGCSASPDFPWSLGAVQTALAGAYNAFVTKLAPAGSSLAYSTFLGGSGSDDATAIAVDPSGQAVIGGYTSSSNFPALNAVQPAFRGAFDAFAAVLNSSGTSLVFSSYFGGASDDRAYAVAVTSGNRLFLAGTTSSSDFPTASAIAPAPSGNYDAFALGATYYDAPVNQKLAFYTLPPCRIADTRSVGGSGKTGAFGPPYLAGASTRTFPILSSSCNIPGAAQAYSLNVTVVPHKPLGQLTVWPSGAAVPQTLTLAASAGQIVANAAITAAGVGGAVSVYASNDTDVILDINGYFAPPGPKGLAFYPLTPCRVADTRSVGGSGKTGSFGPPQMTAGSTRAFPVLSAGCNVPSSALAYSLNMTVAPPSSLLYLTTWPTGQSIPWVSTLNDMSGAIVANAAIVPAGNGGSINVFVSNTSDVIIDINGYFAPPGPQGLYYYSLGPCRIADTLASGGFSGAFGPPGITAGGARSFPVQSSACNVPAAAQAYSLSLAVVPPGPMLFLTIWPTGQPIPWVSTLNDLNGWVVANAALVPAGTNGAVSVYVYAASGLIMDIGGYFAP